MTNPGNGSAIGVIGRVQQDHAKIKAMMTEVETTTGEAKRDAFEDLVRQLAVHETAEEEVVHPLAKDAGGDQVANERLREEDAAKKLLADLDGMDVTSPDFEPRFTQLRMNVLEHAEREEREEHPLIAGAESPEELERAGRLFGIAESMAPTHPHRAAPESRAGNLVMGPILTIVDDVRDAIRDARRKSAG